MANLYDIATRFDNVISLALDDSIELDVLEQALQEIESQELQPKVENGIGIIKTLEMYRDGMKAEAKRLSSQASVIDNRLDRIKEWYKVNLTSMSKDKVVTNRGTMSIRKNPPALVIDDENAIPVEYLTIIPEHCEINKAALKTALKDTEVPGAHLSQGYSLRIS